MSQQDIIDMRYCSRDFLKEFIKLYQSLTALWKIKSSEYSDRYAKNQAYDILTKKIREVEPGADKETVKKKINSMRTTYRKEFKKVRASMKSANSLKDIYKPCLWYYELLSFLSEQEATALNYEELEIKILPSEWNSEPDAGQPSSTDSSTGIRAPSPMSSTTVMPSDSSTTTRDSFARDIYTNPTDQRMSLSGRCEDRFDIVGINVAAKLRCLPDRQRIIAEKLINDILFEAELGNLTTACRLIVRSSKD